MNEKIVIGNSEITVKEWCGERVVTFADIDAVHERVSGTARKRFHDHKDKFIENKHYYFVTLKSINEKENQAMIEKSELRTFEILKNLVTNRGLMLITERGYLLLVKVFNDDLSWQIQEQLVDSYFTVRQSAQETVNRSYDGLSPQMRLIMEMAQQMAEAERERQEMQSAIRQHTETIENIKEAVTQIPQDGAWRSVIYKKIMRIAFITNKENPGILFNKLYNDLELRAKCNLDTRLKHYKERLLEQGNPPSLVKQKNKLDVINRDDKLREIFTKIVSEYEIKYVA